MMCQIQRLVLNLILMKSQFFIKITSMINSHYKPKSEISDELVEKIINHLN